MSDNQVRTSATVTRTAWILNDSDIRLGDLRKLVEQTAEFDADSHVTVDKLWGRNADRTSAWFKRIDVAEHTPIKPGATE